ncbi:MAG: glucose-6-phosphate dehydrogenase [Patescibacteria group bacterium]
MNPTILVLFGATGDLVAKKILPALLNLWKEQNLPEQFSIVAYGRRDLTDTTFRDYVREILLKRTDLAVDAVTLNSFLEAISYHQGQFDVEADYAALSNTLAAMSDGPTGYVYYLAVPPELTKTIANGLHGAGLTTDGKDGTRRIIIEKPIGTSAPSADEIESVLEKTFAETQIYRIDHYLAKEMVQNIMAFRFSNSLFEGIWNNHSIERIDIRLWETLGVESRGAFYDGLGTLRDVGQNHLLQMLAFVTMDHPEDFVADEIRHKRAEVLRALRVWSPKEIVENTRRAQYDGYSSIEGVAKDSQTETYFRVNAAIDTPRWKNVEIMLESGKRMGRARKEIVVTFKPPENCLCHADADEHQQNIITFAIEPKEGIMIDFWSKKPGLDFDVERRSFDFMLRDIGERSQYIEEYEKLLLDGIIGDQTLFVDKDEVKAMWRFIDPIVNAWKEGAVPLERYTADTAPDAFSGASVGRRV